MTDHIVADSNGNPDYTVNLKRILELRQQLAFDLEQHGPAA